MSILIAALQQAKAIGPSDCLVIDQGSPPVTRRCTVAQFLAASGISSGPVGFQPPNLGPLKISQLPFANQVYLNDLMVVDIGLPPITYKVPVGLILGLSATGRTANTERTTANKSVLVSELPTFVAVPVPGFTYTPTKGNVPFSVQFTDTSTPGFAVTAWNWDFGDGSAQSTLQNPTHTYTTQGTGSYVVTLTVTIYGNQYQVQHSVSTVSDPYFSNVVLLLLMKEPAGTAQLVDSSQFHAVPTAGTGVQTSNTPPVPGVQPYQPRLNSAAGDTTLTFPLSTNYGNGVGGTAKSYTIEFWMQTIAPANYGASPDWITFNNYDANPNFISASHLYNYANVPLLRAGVSGTDPFSGASISFSGNTWHFVSETWDSVSKLLSICIDGVQVYSTTLAASPCGSISQQILIGGGLSNGNNTTSLMGPVRYTVGANRYPPGALPYTPPVANFPTS